MGVVQKVDGDGKHRDGTAVARLFLDKDSGIVVKVVNVHAGHNGTTHKVDWKSAKKALHEIQALKGHTGHCDMTLIAGDFNEMTQVVGHGVIGHGFSKRKTHKMGANDKVGAAGSNVSAFSYILGSFGSDHKAVKLRAKKRPGSSSSSSASSSSSGGGSSSSSSTSSPAAKRHRAEATVEI